MTISRRNAASFDAGDMFGFGLIIAVIVSALACIAGWITHVVICIKTTSWILLVFGCVVAPIGVIHGIGSWFGVFG